MANELKGEVAFETKSGKYTLLYSINALVELESALGHGVGEIGALLQTFKEPDKVKLSVLRTVFRCGLTDYHPEIDDKAAGRLMTEIGLDQAANLLHAGILAAYGTAPETPAAGAPGPLAKPVGQEKAKPG